MTNIAIAGGPSLLSPLAQSPLPDMASSATYVSSASQPESANQPLTMAADRPVTPVQVHGTGSENAPITGRRSPDGGIFILSGQDRATGAGGKVIGVVPSWKSDSPTDAPAADGSLPVRSRTGAGTIGKLMPDGEYIPVPNPEAARRGEKWGGENLGESGDKDAGAGANTSEFSSLGQGVAHTAATVWHAVSSAANATGDAATSAAETLAVPVGVATVIGGVAAVGVYALGGLAAIF